MSEVSKVVEKYVSDNNVSIVRSSLIRILKYLDLESLNSFIVSLKYAEEKMDDLYEEDNGTILLNDVSETNYKKIMEELGNNFSEKKCKHIINIGTMLYGKNTESVEAKKVEKRNVENKVEERGLDEEIPFSTKKNSKVMFAAGTAIVLVIIILIKILK